MSETIRLDKFLWQARFFKTRTLAARRVNDGKVRVNSERVRKAATLIRATDVLSFPQGDTIRVVRVLILPQRRGPAPEAMTLYDDLTPPEPPKSAAEPRVPRPDKRDRRAIMALRRQDP